MLDLQRQRVCVCVRVSECSRPEMTQLASLAVHLKTKKETQNAIFSLGRGCLLLLRLPLPLLSVHMLPAGRWVIELWAIDEVDAERGEITDFGRKSLRTFLITRITVVSGPLSILAVAPLFSSIKQM